MARSVLDEIRTVLLLEVCNEGYDGIRVDARVAWVAVDDHGQDIHYDWHPHPQRESDHDYEGFLFRCFASNDREDILVFDRPTFYPHPMNFGVTLKDANRYVRVHRRIRKSLNEQIAKWGPLDNFPSVVAYLIRAVGVKYLVAVDPVRGRPGTGEPVPYIQIGSDLGDWIRQVQALHCRRPADQRSVLSAAV
jgi:hypothetical protein